VVVGLLALVNLFVLHAQPFGGRYDFIVSSAAASTAFVYVIAIILPTRSRRPQTAIEGMIIGFLLSGSMVHVISTNLVWLANLPPMAASASVGAAMVIIGCCMCLFVGRR